MKQLLILLLPLLVLLLPAQTLGQTTNRAGIVVKFGDGRVQTSCVSFQTESISGFELLQRSGWDVIAQTSGGNAAVCKIGPDGCAFPAEPCFCKFGGGQQGQYWAYWRLSGGAWQYAAQGAALQRVTNGDVDGWTWGTGSVSSGEQPPLTSFEQICPAAPIEPTAEPQPTAVPQPTARPTARPTIIPTPRPTIAPTERPTARPTAPVVGEAPTATPELPSATALSSATSTTTPTIIPTSTAQPTTTPTSTATSTSTAAQPTETPALTPTSQAEPESQRSNLGGYALFGAMLTGLLGAIGFAQWRRRQ